MMKRGSITWLFVLGITVLPISVFAVVRWYESNYKKLPVYGSEEHRIEAYSFADQDGSVVNSEQDERKIVVTNFFFTHCPVICPKMTRNLKDVQRMYFDDSTIVIRSLTVDPERDSVGQLKSYATKFDIGGRWRLLTGDKREIYRLARKSFLVDASDGDGGPDDFMHSDKLVLSDGEGRIRGYYKGTDAAETGQLIKDISKLRKEH